MQEIGLYHPDYEHDACGVGLLVNIHGNKSHEIVEKGLQVLEHMLHRGAEPETGLESCCKFHMNLSFCKVSPYLREENTEQD